MDNPDSTTNPFLGISPAAIQWRDDMPVATQFDDLYFSRENGIEEARHVFLQQNDLPSRFAALSEQLANQENTVKIPPFVIGETGFGTGLNFLCAWQLRDQIAPKLPLHFMSVEKHPLTRGDLKRALSLWPGLAPYAEHLIERYPSLTPGWHRLSFYPHRVELSLYLGDASEGFSDANANKPNGIPPSDLHHTLHDTLYEKGYVNAWFLDGFSPAKNPTMWQPELFKEIAQLSANDASFSTFTAAAAVRDGLRQAGFAVERVPGFGRKRHMLRGRINTTTAITDPSRVAVNSTAPWFTRVVPTVTQRNAIVIGGGLAGASVAHSLAKRDWKVTVLESQNNLAQAASGNRQGILYHKISAEPSLKSGFYTAGFLYARQQITQLLANQPESWQACGVLQLAYNDSERQRQQRLLAANPPPADLAHPVSASEASDLSGIPLDQGGLYFPGSGWVTLAALCRAQVEHPNIEIVTGVEARQLNYDQDRWQVRDTGGEHLATAAIVIMANASGALGFEQSKQLPLKAIRGQVSSFPITHGNEAVQLKTVICGNHYIAPAIDGRYYTGASFNLDSDEAECRLEDHQENLMQLIELIPEFSKLLQLDAINLDVLQGRVGFRCGSPDYLPLIGPLPDRNAFLKDYAHLRHDAKTRFSQPGRFLPGLFASLGHGSKGLTSCLLAGEIIASQLCNEPPPLSYELTNAVHPARFLIRDLIRNRV